MVRLALVLLIVMALGVMVAAWWLAEGVAAEDAMTRQKSSHDAGFFESLLRGRVWVYQRAIAASPSIRDYVNAAYFHADGRMTACTATADGGVDHSGRWRVVPSDRFVSLFNYIAPGAEPDPRHVRDHGPIFYDPESGQFHSEAWVSEDSWEVFLRGWVQESWPAVLVDVCPDVRAPEAVPLNRKQRSEMFRTLMREDPAAALRRFPGSERRVPGALGLAAAQGRPTLGFVDDLSRHWW